MMAWVRGAASWLALGGCAGMAVAAPGPAPAHPQAASAGVARGGHILTPDVITDERGRTVAVERGLLFVPENRRKPGSRLIAIHFVRFPSVRPVAAGRPPVFLLAGGPGWGFDLSDPLVFDEITRLRATREVISVSQRGYSGAPGLVPEFSVTLIADTLFFVHSETRLWYQFGLKTGGLVAGPAWGGWPSHGSGSMRPCRTA